MKSQNIGKFLNYLERTIGIDLEECIMEFEVSGDPESVMIWFQNGKNLSINSIGTVGADGQEEENGNQKSIFFVMESRAFFQVYEAVFPTIKHCFIS